MRRVRRAVTRVFLVAFGVLIAVAALECGLRLVVPAPAFDPTWGMGSSVGADGQASYVPDEELGYVPRIDGPVFNEFGTIRNPYPVAKRDGIERVLFLGDSVTERRRIVDALSVLHGEATCEYWIAGVGGYNTVQEVRFFERYASRIEPDHVVLTFHNNDFFTTPVALRDESGDLVVYAGDRPTHGLGAWLYRNSRVARAVVDWSSERGGVAEVESRAGVTRDALARLRDQLAASGVQLTVLLFPILNPRDRWKPGETRSREIALELFDELGLRSIDLLEPIERSIHDGVDVREQPDDTWHPNWEAGRRMAQFALRHGLLDGGVMDDRVSIHADPSRISLASGGQQVLTIDAGRHRAGRSFLVLGSASGTEPSTSLHALPVPLVDDGYFQLTLAQPGAWIRYDGVLDENGRGRAIVAYPAGSDATLGTLHHACVLYQAFPLAFHAVSAAVALELTR